MDANEDRVNVPFREYFAYEGLLGPVSFEL